MGNASSSRKKSEGLRVEIPSSSKGQISPHGSSGLSDDDDDHRAISPVALRVTQRSPGGDFGTEKKKAVLGPVPFCRKLERKKRVLPSGLEALADLLQQLEAVNASPVANILFTPDNHQVVIGFEDGHIRAFDAFNAEEVLQIRFTDGEEVRAMSFERSGRRLAVACGNSVYVVDMSTHEVLYQLSAHTRTVTCASFTPEGSKIVSGSEDGTVAVWNAENGQLIRISSSEEYSSNVYCLAVSPDSQRLLTGHLDNSTVVWNISQGLVLDKVLVGHRYTVQVLAYSPSGEVFASGSQDGTIRVYGAASLKRRHVLSSVSDQSHIYVSSMAFSPQNAGKLLAVGYNKDLVRVWDFDTGERLWEQGDKQHGDSEITYVSFVSKGRYLVTASSEVTCVWQAQSGAIVHKVRHDEQLKGNAAQAQQEKKQAIGRIIPGAAASSDGKCLAIRCHTDAALIDLRGAGSEVLFVLEDRNHAQEVYQTNISPDNQMIAVRSTDTNAYIYSASSGGLMCELGGHKDAVTFMEFSKDGTSIVTAAASQIKLWRRRDSSSDYVCFKSLDHEAVIGGQHCFSKDESTLLTTLRGMPLIIAWNMRNGELLYKFSREESKDESQGLATGREEDIRSIFSFDGHRVAVVLKTGAVEYWHDGKRVKVVYSHDDMKILKFTDVHCEDKPDADFPVVSLLGAMRIHDWGWARTVRATRNLFEYQITINGIKDGQARVFGPMPPEKIVVHGEFTPKGTVVAALVLLLPSRTRSDGNDDIGWMLATWPRHVDDSIRDEIRQVFSRLDKDGDGYITKKELMDAYRQGLGGGEMEEDKLQEAAEDMLRRADIDGDGRIDYTEWLQFRTRQQLVLDRRLNHLVMSPDDRYLVTLNERYAKVWDLRAEDTNEPMLLLRHKHPIHYAMFSAENSNILLTYSKQEVIAWDPTAFRLRPRVMDAAYRFVHRDATSVKEIKDSLLAMLERYPGLVNEVDARGRTMLHYACELHNPETVRLLLDKGNVRSFLPDSENQTPLTICIHHRAQDCLQVLLEYVPKLQISQRDSVVRAFPALIKLYPHLVLQVLQKLDMETPPQDVQHEQDSLPDNMTSPLLVGSELFAPPKFWKRIIRQHSNARRPPSATALAEAAAVATPRGELPPGAAPRRITLEDGPGSAPSRFELVTSRVGQEAEILLGKLSADRRRHDAPGVAAQAKLVPLPGLTSYYPKSSENPLRAIQSGDHAELLGTKALQHVLEFKWQQYGRRIFLLMFAKYAVFLALFSVLTLTDVSTADGDLDTFKSWARLVLEILLLAWSFYYFAYEVRQVSHDHLVYFRSPWNVIELLGYLLTFIVMILRLSERDEKCCAPGVQGITGIAAVILWIKTLSFARGFHSTGPFVRMIFQIMQRIVFFMLVLLVVIVSFSHGFFLLYETSASASGSHAEIIKDYNSWYVMLKVYSMMYGEFDLADLEASSLDWLATIFFVGFTVFVAIVMLNLLIALMNDIYQEIEKNVENQWMLERLKILLEIEAFLTKEQKLDKKKFPTYLHVLEPRGEASAPKRSVQFQMLQQLVDVTERERAKAEGMRRNLDDMREAVKGMAKETTELREGMGELSSSVNVLLNSPSEANEKKVGGKLPSSAV